MVAALLFNRNGLLAITGLITQRRAVSLEMDSLTCIVDSLRNEIELLQTDSAYMEKVVREILGWGRSGELIIRFVPPGTTEDSH